MITLIIIIHILTAFAWRKHLRNVKETGVDINPFNEGPNALTMSMVFGTAISTITLIVLIVTYLP